MSYIHLINIKYIKFIKIRIQDSNNHQWMQKRNWLEISHTLLQRYKIYSLYSTLKSLPLQIFYTAVSSFCGPIALLLDRNITHQFILPESLTNSIIILNCKGQLMKTIGYGYRDRIVFMGFTGIEELLVVEASGEYWLIDAFSGQILQGNYSAKEDKQEKYRGCELMLSNKLVMLRDKQLGYTESLTSTWQPIPEAKIKVQNPIFCAVFNSAQQFVYLTRQHAIQIYNLTDKKRSTLYSDSYLNTNWQNLLAMSYNKEKNLLGLAFKNPSIIFYIQLQTNTHKRLDAMIELKYDLSCSNTPNLSYKYISKSFYKPTDYTLSWLECNFTLDQDLEQLSTSILVFANPKLLLMYDGKSTRLTPRSNCNQLVSVEMDCLRVYTEDSHEIYRVVPYLYQTVLEINRINQGYYRERYMKIIQLYDQYTNYLEKDIIDLGKLDALWRMGNRSMPVKGRDKSQSGDEKKEPNEQQGDQHNFYLNKENTDDVVQKISKIEQSIIMPLIRIVRYCIDPVDQVKLLKFIFFIKNLYTCPIDIYQLCHQMRIVNNLKFEFLSRTLTISQFEYLKYEAKDRFLTMLLRYRMHFIGDTIFKDSDSKYKIFLHWAKCKIEKSSQSISFEEIKQKFENMPKKIRNSKVFTDIAKYSLDRGKLGLADKIIELQQNPERKIMVYLLILTSTTDKKIVQKLLDATQECTRSFLIFRVIRQLIEASWIETHAWVNILYQKPNVARHYIRYLKAHGKEELLKNYFFQNKDYQNLGYYGVERMFDVGKGEEPQIPKYSEEALNNFIPKVEELKKFLPNLSTVTKSYAKNAQMDLLRKVKSGDYLPSQQDLKTIKNDLAFEYLGQILYQKQKIEAAVSAMRRIKSDNVYNILMRKQRFRDAIELAGQRKNREALLEIKQKCPTEYQDLVEQNLSKLMTNKR